MNIHRRELLASTAWLLAGVGVARASVIIGQLPWAPNAGSPPALARPGDWHFFTADEAHTVEALADRIIPSDPDTPGGKDAGCAVYVDRQLAGPYGHAEGNYNRGPILQGMKNQGVQSASGPSKEYRDGIAALNRYTAAHHDGKPFAQLTAEDQDTLLKGLESGDIKLEGADGKKFFEQVVKDVQMGFFADPLYGGNRDMAAWKMIGFPGARYNYLDWIDRHNEPYPLPPVGITGRPAWKPGGR